MKYCRNRDIHTHVYDVSVQSGAEIRATTRTGKKIKNAIGLVTPSPNSDISYSTALRVVGVRLEEAGHCREARTLEGIILYLLIAPCFR